MIIVMKSGTPEAEISRLSQELQTWGLQPEKIVGSHKILLGLVGNTAELDPLRIQELSPWIEQVLRVEKPYKRASRTYRHGEPSEVMVSTPNGPVYIGENRPLVWFFHP